MRSKKQKIKRIVKDMLIESHKKALQSIDKVLNSGCVDIDAWDEGEAPMVLPKCILTAILEDEARQYTARGTSYEKQTKKEIANIRYFL
ncbi:MAG: hypothetical protein ACJARG_000046 [Arcticibacterium sp.]|jgi:hypothetical protein